MSEHKVELKWTRETEFEFAKYNRSHLLTFSGSQVLQNSAAPEFMGDNDMSNPEELFASALASCHMLTFLAVAAKSGYMIESYSDKAVAILDKNEEGRTAITQIDLFPQIEFLGTKIPSAEELKVLHDRAHRNCFIASSIKTKVNIH
jgi:organic hydroperoxide reductase OsmC/OhrA